MYIYSNKVRKKVHVMNNDTGKSWCQTENGLSGRSIFKLNYEPKVPSGREICRLCQSLMNKKPKKKKAQIQNRPKVGKNFYATREWARLRYEVLSESDGHCELCGATEKLVVDHIKPARKYPELAFCKENLQVLCNMCNWGKGAKYETDHRTDKNLALDKEFRDIVS